MANVLQECPVITNKTLVQDTATQHVLSAGCQYVDIHNSTADKVLKVSLTQAGTTYITIAAGGWYLDFPAAGGQSVWLTSIAGAGTVEIIEKAR